MDGFAVSTITTIVRAVVEGEPEKNFHRQYGITQKRGIEKWYAT